MIKAERDAAWDKYFEKTPENAESCLLSQMLNKRVKLAQGHSLNDNRIKAELLIAILAGTTTAATILNSVLLNVAAQENFSEQLASEINSASHNDGQVRYELSRNLSYLAACVQEAYRVSAGPTQFPRLVDASQDTEVNGIRLPPGTVISSSSYVVSRNEALFGSQLDDFLPERWLNVSEDIMKARRKYDFRFGYGARTCLGKHLVELEIHNAAFEVFRRAKVTVHDKARGMISMRLRTASDI